MKTLWSLLAVALLLGGYILFVDRDRPSTDERRAGRTRLVPRLDTASVERITIVRRPGGSSEARLTLTRQPPGREPAWRVEDAGGGTHPADEAAVADLLAAIDFAEVERSADISPAAAGLDRPEVRLELQSAKGPVVLELGRSDASGGGVFVRLGDDPTIRVGPKRLRDLAGRDATAFRDRRLIPARPDEVTSIVWDEGREQRALRLADGRWRNARGEPVAGERVREVLQRLLALRVARYGDPPPAASAGEGRRLEVSGSATTEVMFPPDAAERGLVRRGGEGAVLEAPETIAGLWSGLRAAAVRDDRLVSNPPESVTRVELSDGTRRLVLRRIGGAWRIGPPEVEYEADGQAVAAWLAELHGARPALGPLQPGARRIVVEGQYREAVEVSTPKAIFAELAPEPLRFRDRNVLSFARMDARRLARRAGAAADAVEAIRDEGGGWRLRGAGVGVPDAAGIAQVVGALAELRADSFETRPPRGAPALILEVDVLAPGEKTPRGHRLELFPAATGGCPARLDATTVFILPRETCDRLGAPLGS